VLNLPSDLVFMVGAGLIAGSLAEYKVYVVVDEGENR
jgi:hypothetical protein